MFLFACTLYAVYCLPNRATKNKVNDTMRKGEVGPIVIILCFTELQQDSIFSDGNIVISHPGKF